MIFKKQHSQTFRIKSEKDFERLYHSYAETMLSIAYNHTQDKEISKELVQNVFKSLWERKDKLQIQGPTKNYLFRAIKLEVIDHYRQKSRDAKHLACALQEVCLHSEYTEEQIAFNELSNQLELLVDRLPCQCREVYKLSRERGLTNKEIAATLLIAEKTVESHLTKALKFIRKELMIDRG